MKGKGKKRGIKGGREGKRERGREDTVKSEEEKRRSERRTNGSDPRVEAEPLCSLIKPGVARLGGVCAVAGGVRVAPEDSGQEGGW